MSVSSNTDTSYSFHEAFTQAIKKVDDRLNVVVYKFPKEGIKNYSMDEKGNFTIEYASIFEGTATHFNEDLQSSLDGSVFKIDKIVSGTLDSSSKTLKFKSGVSVKQKMALGTMKVQLTEVAVRNDKELELSGFTQILVKISQSVTLSRDDISFTSIAWGPKL